MKKMNHLYSNTVSVEEELPENAEEVVTDDNSDCDDDDNDDNDDDEIATATGFKKYVKSWVFPQPASKQHILPPPKNYTPPPVSVCIEQLSKKNTFVKPKPSKLRARLRFGEVLDILNAIREHDFGFIKNCSSDAMRYIKHNECIFETVLIKCVNHRNMEALQFFLERVKVSTHHLRVNVSFQACMQGWDEGIVFLCKFWSLEGIMELMSL